MGFLGIFAGRPIRRHTYKPRRAGDDLKKDVEAQNLKWATSRLIRRAENDPDMERAVIGKFTGIDFTEIDEATKQKRELDNILAREAVEILKTDPALKQQFARSKLEAIVGQLNNTNHDDDDEGGYGYPRNPITEMMDNLDALEALQERMGKNKPQGALGGLITPEVLIAGLNMLNNYLGGGKQLPASEPLIACQQNGKIIQLPKSQFDQLNAKGLVQPVGVLSAPVSQNQPVPPPEPTHQNRTAVPPPAMPVQKATPPPPMAETSLTTEVDIPSLLGMVNLEPEEFMEHFIEDYQSGMKYTEIIMNNIDTLTPDSLEMLLNPYRQHPDYGGTVTNLLSLEKSDWVADVIYRLREYKKEIDGTAEGTNPQG